MAISGDACLIFGVIAGIVAVYVTPCVTYDDVVDEETEKARNLKPKIVVHNPDGDTISNGMKDKILGERTFARRRKSDPWKLIIWNGNTYESSSGASFHSANEHFTNRHRIGMSPSEIDTETLDESDNTTYIPLDLSIRYPNKRRNVQGTFNNIVDGNNNIKEKRLRKSSEDDIELIGSLRHSTFIDTPNEVSHMAQMRNAPKQSEGLGEHAAADESTQETVYNNKLVIILKKSVKPFRTVFQNIYTKSRSKRKTCEK